MTWAVHPATRATAKTGREQIAGDAHHAVQRRGVQVDVGIDLPPFAFAEDRSRDLLDPPGQVKPVGVAAPSARRGATSLAE